MKKRETIRERLLKHSKLNKKTGCRLWTGAVNRQGYGQIRTGYGGNRRVEKAHRVSYKENKGPIPVGMLVLHSCDRPRCIEPEHLFLGTHAINVADKIAKGRPGWSKCGRKGKKHWAYGRARRPKLTAEQVAAIRAAKSASRAALARQYGVTVGYIWRIRRGECR